MPHDTNTIYSNSSYGISIGDIQQFFGNSRNDIGSLISNVTINKWAKYKPVRSAKLGILSDSDRKSVQQGLSTTIYTQTGEPTSSLSFFYALLAGNLPWSYNRPRGMNGGGTGIHEWYRFLDFDGYDKRATEPISAYSEQTVMLTYDNKLVLNWVDSFREDYELSIEDLQVDSIDLKDWYFGALIFSQSDNTYTFAATDTIEDGGFSVEFDDMQSWVNKTVKMVPFLSTIPLQGTALSGGKYISLFGQTPVDITIISSSSGVYAYPEGMWNLANTTIDYTIRIDNTGLAKSTSLVITLMEGDAYATPLRTRTVSPYSIGAGETDTITGSFTGLTKSNNPYFIAITSSGDTVIRFTYNQVEDYNSPES